MASILDLLSTKTGTDFIEKAKERTSEDKDTIIAALGMALPTLLAAMLKNVKSEEGEKSLNKALEDNKHGEFFIRNFKNKKASEMAPEGDKILQHILGDNQKKIAGTIADTLQIEESSVVEINKMAATLLMSILGTQKKNEKVGPSEMENLIKSVMGNSTKYDNSLIESLLNKGGEINVITDIEGMILGGKTKGNNEGGLLGGMLGGK